MLVLLSPAKRLDFEPSTHTLDLTRPALIDRTADLSKATAKLSKRKIKTMMELSEGLIRDYRQKDRPTDVLAFAMREGEHGDLDPGLLARSPQRQPPTLARPKQPERHPLHAHQLHLESRHPVRLRVVSGPRFRSQWDPSVNHRWRARDPQPGRVPHTRWDTLVLRVPQGPRSPHGPRGTRPRSVSYEARGASYNG